MMTSSPATASPAVADQLDSLAALLTSRAQAVRNGAAVPPQQHIQLVKGLKDAAGLVNEAREDLGDLMMSFVQVTALRLLIKWKVFEAIPLEGTISYADVAARVGIDVNLISTPFLLTSFYSSYTSSWAFPSIAEVRAEAIALG